MTNTERVPPDRYPWWVNFAKMGGASTRDRMIFFFALSVGLIVVSLALWVMNERWYWLLIGLVSIPLAAMYPLAIGWIDRHGQWPQ